MGTLIRRIRVEKKKTTRTVETVNIKLPLCMPFDKKRNCLCADNFI